MRSWRVAPLLLSGTLAVAAVPPYLGETPPGDQPRLFAADLLGTGLSTRDITFLPDFTECYVGVFMPGFRKAAIVGLRREGGAWRPEVAPFSRDPRWRCLEPCVSPDGRRFFFVSDRPADPAGETPGPFGIWVMEREGTGWSQARRLPAAVNGSGNVFYPSVTRDGVLYFLQEEGQGGWILRSAFRDGAWTPAEKLPAPFNASPAQANPRVDPEGRYLLLPMEGRPDSLGGADYYGYFRRDDGTWAGPVNLGPAVNSPARDEYSINPGPDGRVVFFASNRTLPRLDGKLLTWEALLAERTLPGNGQNSLWWVDAGFLEAARAKALEPQRPQGRVPPSTGR